MFTLSSKHIFRNVFTTTAVVSIFIILVMWLIQSLRFVELLLKSKSSVKIFFSFSLSIIPDLLVIVLPISVFISVLFVYYKMWSDRELVAWRSLGHSNWELARPALFFASLCTLFSLAMQIWVLPQSFRSMREMEHSLKHALPSVLIQEGVFNVVGDFVVFVHKKLSRGNIRGVFVHVDKGKGETYTVSAEQGTLQKKDGIPTLYLKRGVRQSYNAEKKILSTLSFDNTYIQIDLSDVKPPGRSKKAYEMELSDLLLFEADTQEATQRLRGEGFQRLISPFFCVALAGIALSFVLLAGFHRKSVNYIMVYSVLFGICVKALGLVFLNWGYRNVWGTFLAAMLIIGISVGCLIILMREPTHEKRRVNI